MVTQRDYTAKAVAAARSVLIEVIHLLGEYRQDIVLVGGWVPEILLGGREKPHIGSMDVDLALNHLKLKEAGYKTIQALLLGRGYEQGEKPFMFHREVSVSGTPIITFRTTPADSIRWSNCFGLMWNMGWLKRVCRRWPSILPQKRL